MKYYQMYGLVVCSTFPIPEALEIAPCDDYDVYVEMGAPPKEDLDAAKAGKICRLEKEICWFYLQDLGLFYVEQGSHVIIWRESELLTELSKNSYLTGTVMGLLMFQREILPIHSSAVSKDGKAILVVGDSGAGKSTNCMKLREKGCLFMSDDVSAVTIEGEQVMVSPAFPQQKLCRDAALRQGYDLDDLIYIDENRDKYAVRLKEGYEKEALPMGMIVELIPTDEKEVTVHELRGLDKLSLLYRNIYRGYALNAIGISMNVQSNILKIAEKIPMYQIVRPKRGFHSETIADWILQNL